MGDVYLPPGWPLEVPAPGDVDFPTAAAQWLFDHAPPQLRDEAVMRRHPLILAYYVRNHLAAELATTRHCWSVTPAALADLGIPEVTDMVRAACSASGVTWWPPATAPSCWIRPCGGNPSGADCDAVTPYPTDSAGRPQGGSPTGEHGPSPSLAAGRLTVLVTSGAWSITERNCMTRHKPGLHEPGAMRESRYARLALAVPAVLGAALSFRSLYEGAPAVFGALRLAFPIAVDGVVLGASLRYVFNTRNRRPGGGWRALAWLGIALTLVLNALAARTASEVAWHVAGPAIWAAYVELAALDARTDLRRQRRSSQDADEPIPLALWLTCPLDRFDTVGLWLWMRRTGTRSYVHARVERARYLAALQALRDAGMGRRRRRFVARLLHGGALPAATVIISSRSHEAGPQAAERIMEAVLDAVSRTVGEPSASAHAVHSGPRPARTPRAPAGTTPGAPASALSSNDVHSDRAYRGQSVSAPAPAGSHSGRAAAAAAAADDAPGAGLPEGVETGGDLDDETLVALIRDWLPTQAKPSARRTARRYRVAQERAGRLLECAGADWPHLAAVRNTSADSHGNVAKRTA